MHIHTIFPVLAATLIVAGSVAPVQGETRVSCNTVPAAVLQQAKTQVPGASIRGCVKDKENGKLTYEVETVTDGKSTDMTFNPSGGLIEVEQQVDRDSLPAAVSTALTRSANGGEVGKIESVTRGGSIVSYETTIKRKGRRSEVAFSPEGTPMKAD